LQAKKEDQSLLFMQQQIDPVRVQLSQALDNNTQLIQQQLGQILGHVSERLKDNVEVLQRTQQSLGERLDHAAPVVGNVQKGLGGLEEAHLLGKHLGHTQSTYTIKLPRNAWHISAGDFLLPTGIPSLSNILHTIVRQDSQSIRNSEDVLICG
jgi:hypothetical protein